MGDFANRPKILRGAFVEFGISLPPLMVVFQFNPLTISRTRSSYVNPPQTPLGTQSEQGQEVRQIDQPLGLFALLRRQRLSRILPIEKRL